MSEKDVAIGENVTKLRGAKTQQDVADAMRARGYKWSQATVWAVEKGERPLRLAEASDLAAILDQQVDALVSNSLEAALLNRMQESVRAVATSASDLRAAAKAYEDARKSLEAVLGLAGESLRTERVGNGFAPHIRKWQQISAPMLEQSAAWVVQSEPSDG